MLAEQHLQDSSAWSSPGRETALWNNTGSMEYHASGLNSAYFPSVHHTHPNDQTAVDNTQKVENAATIAVKLGTTEMFLDDYSLQLSL